MNSVNQCVRLLSGFDMPLVGSKKLKLSIVFLRISKT